MTWHPIGVIFNDDDSRELQIEGEKCCGVSFNTFQQIGYIR
jgi:hypothetical protein